MSDEHDHRDSEISHIYKEGGWPEPSRQIDQAILAASRRAARREHSFVRRWSPPFALAATVVLSFTLFLRVSEEKPDALISPPIPDRQPAAPAEESRSAEKSRSGVVEKPAPAPKPRAASQPAQSLATRKSAPAPKSAAASKPAPPQRVTPAAKPAPVERAAPAARTAPVPQPAPEASTLKKEAPEARADRLEPVPGPRSQSRRAPESAPAREVRPEARAPLPPAPPGAIEPFAQQSGPAATGAASGASAASDAAARIVIRRSALERSPQAWIEAIRKLMAEGRIEEAGRELADFRTRYPDYALPEDLR